jgi:hypothetical protein
MIIRLLTSALTLLVMILEPMTPRVFLPATDGILATGGNETLTSFPSLVSFVNNISETQDETLTGIYIPDHLAVSVIQQPSGNPAFVSSEENVVTQFKMANSYGSTGLLAHNHLAGSSFAGIKDNNTIVVVYGDGSLGYYDITQIEQYQALSPNSPYSSFMNLSDPSQVLSATDLFMHIYASPGRLVLQTCIAKDGEPSWGRLFILAEKIQTP